MIAIRELAPHSAATHASSLEAVLVDAVDSGASVGFHPPLSSDAARGYWRETLVLLGGLHRLYGAFDGPDLVGCAQLILSGRANGPHRGEVAKVLVHRRARRQGIGATLMQHIEREASAIGRTLLILDTRTGDDAERLYLRLGWTRFGLVPRYTVDVDGTRKDTSFFYKELAGV